MSKYKSWLEKEIEKLHKLENKEYERLDTDVDQTVVAQKLSFIGHGIHFLGWALERYCETEDLNKEE